MPDHQSVGARVAEERKRRAERELHSVVPALRRELAAYCAELDGEVPPRPFDQLRAGVAEASRLRHEVNLSSLGASLPALLAEIRTALHAARQNEKERIYALLAEAYYAASQVAWKLGYADLASLGVDRYVWAAGRSGDELAVLVGDYQRAGEMIAVADWTAAQRFLEKSRSVIEPRLGKASSDTLQVSGSLHLKSGLAAARAGDLDTADAHLAEARETAERIGSDGDAYRLAFGPTNVNIWAVALAVEANNGTEAVQRAADFRIPSDTPRERIGHHWIDLSRGYLLHGDREKALSALLLAKRTAPQQTRYHPMVHETIRNLVRSERRRSDTAAGFAAWVGVTV
ncbi:transcriptional regulator [Goodfellowiella coeruleoviolacea]|uniref:Transcriptional regulator n=1 Tax=Goodfellowiella coeruleoviolacea TaxID=334858 RepID=A0AAE3GIQ8_9PSEU|nr:transcriptional regulator [Goodfellowiella coeruleoviolacea]MCP2168363.1 hypothetical protein [Goodfellowiella coeruleoviolacea]